MTSIAFLGLGAMGTRMATRLVRAGHDVTVWNRDPARAEPLVAEGARAAASPGEAVDGAEIAIAMVHDDEASRRVWLDEDGALVAMRAGAIAVESSTLTVDWVKKLAQQAQAKGIAFVEAPVAGSRPQAEAGQLIYLLGGEAATVARIEPVLKPMGSAVHHVGPSGTGAALKLAVNALFAVQVAAVAELIGLLEAAGVETDRAIEVMAQTPVMSPAAKAAAASMLSRTFAPMFPVALVEKDLGYVHAAATAQGGRVPLADAARGVMAEAADRGFGNDNLTGAVRLYRTSTPPAA